MATSNASIEIARRPEDVYTFAVDPLNHPKWDPSAVSAQRENPALQVGTKTRVVHKMGPFKAPFIEEVVELDAPRAFTTRGTSGPLVGVARCTIEPLNNGQRSRVTIALDIEARGVGNLLFPLARRHARKVLPKNLAVLKTVLDPATVPVRSS